MTYREYRNFDITIERSGDSYLIRVQDPNGAPVTAAFDLPFSPAEIENFILRVGRPRRGVRRLDSPEMTAAKRFGARLFEAVFSGNVYANLRHRLDEAQAAETGLRLRLRLGAAELTSLPWEYIYNPVGNQFFSLSADTPLIRYLDLPAPAGPLRLELPLRLLAMIASPSDYPPLDVDDEWRKLTTALDPLVRRGVLVVECLESASLLALQRRLRQSAYHVFHYVGHGSFDEAAQDGRLLFTDEQGRGRPLSGQYLGTLLRDHRSLRLVVLNACEGARSDHADPFAGAAQSLVQMGLPAVIAMQFEITDAAAITFAENFYCALADAYPVDAALAEARKAIFASGNDIEWGTPVLFTRTDGRVFDLLPAPPPGEAQPATPPPDADLPQAQAQAAPRRMRPGSPRGLWLAAGGVALLGIIILGMVLARPWGWFGEKTVSPMSPSLINSNGIPMALIPAGAFQMGHESGKADEGPVHTVMVADFYLDVYEITNARYAECVAAGKCQPLADTSSASRAVYYEALAYADFPVLYVSWENARAYCAWRGARLPTEAEWEKAARGGLEGKSYPWGDEAPVCTPEAANGAQSAACAPRDTLAVGSFAPNGYGLYDMAGNATEWVSSLYQDYPYRAADGREEPQADGTRGLRGGSWNAEAGNLRVAARSGSYPDSTGHEAGFRCAVSPAALTAAPAAMPTGSAQHQPGLSYAPSPLICSISGFVCFSNSSVTSASSVERMPGRGGNMPPTARRIPPPRLSPRGGRARPAPE